MASVVPSRSLHADGRDDAWVKPAARQQALRRLRANGIVQPAQLEDAQLVGKGAQHTLAHRRRSRMRQTVREARSHRVAVRSEIDLDQYCVDAIE
jgi:hypothetical protein